MFCACVFTNQCPQINLVRVAMNGWKHPWCTFCGPDSLTVLFFSWDLCDVFGVLTKSLCELSEAAGGWSQLRFRAVWIDLGPCGSDKNGGW